MIPRRPFNDVQAPRVKRNGHHQQVPSAQPLPALPSGLKAKCTDCGGKGHVCQLCKTTPAQHLHLQILCKTCKGAGAT